MTKYLTTRFILGTLLLATVVTVVVVSPDGGTAWRYAKGQLDNWKEWANANFALAVLLYLTVYILILTPPLPLAAVTALVGGALFGPWWGVPILSVGGITAATLAFLMARYLLHGWVERTFGNRLTRLKAGVERDGGLYVLALRWVPVIPFFVINAVLALTPIRLKTYVSVSWAAMLPFAFLYANAGSQLAQLESPKDAISPTFLVAVSAVAFVPLLLKWVVRKVMKGGAGVPA